MSSRAESRSIAVPIFALVIAAVLVATIIFFAVTFSGPPPRSAPQTIANIARALRNGAERHGPGRALELSILRAAPEPRPGETLDSGTATRIAAALAVDPADVVAFRDERSPLGPDAIAGGFTVGEHVGMAWQVVRTRPEPVFTSWHLVTLMAMLGALLLLAGPAWWIARAISRPLRQIADTATSARVGAALGTVPQGGPSEVRDLTRAVSAMHERLSRHAEGRTAMLAAIAHDLGTPLSRLAFWVEKLPEDARMRANGDIDEMRAMIAATLRFARDEVGERADQRVDLGSLLDSLVEDMSVAGAPVSIEPGPRAIVRGSPQALRRLFANLAENALRYGDVAALSWRLENNMAEILVDDAGPGFDPATAERLFEPFVRGDPSRNRATGGTGLGLAIVRSIAEAHGGTVLLGNHPGGGQVRVVLPIAG